MANCIAKAIGIDSTREKVTHRLGSKAARVTASTWHTSTTAYISKDGSGWVEVMRDGSVIHSFDWNKEGA